VFSLVLKFAKVEREVILSPISKRGQLSRLSRIFNLAHPKMGIFSGQSAHQAARALHSW
jgi:hypothetical protein